LGAAAAVHYAAISDQALSADAQALYMLH